jgi:FkbM family methyltransferase
VAKATTVAREEGLRALLERTRRFLVRPVERYWYTDHTWEGKIVEWMGDRCRIDGVSIDVANPYIATKNKGALWKGIYEVPERRLFHRHFPTDMPLIELGASIGVLACAANRKLARPDQHVVVEAHPYLIPSLERNRALNGCRFKIVNAAIGYGAEQVTFYLAEKFIAGSLETRTGRPVTIPACRLQSVAEAGRFDRFNLVCDIEGTETELVAREADFLRAHVGWFLVEVHRAIVGAARATSLDDRLREHGFELVDRVRRAACYRNTGLLGGRRA